MSLSGRAAALSSAVSTDFGTLTPEGRPPPARMPRPATGTRRYRRAVGDVIRRGIQIPRLMTLQGCNFTCPSCHNPHTIGRCDHCGVCILSCPTGALSLVNGRIVFDAAACTHCDTCLRACPISASPMTHTYELDEIIAIARANRSFLQGSPSPVARRGSGSSSSSPCSPLSRQTPN